MRIVGLVVLVAVAGCATTDVMRLDSVARPQTSPSAVQLLLERPTAPYKAIALVEVSDQGWGLSLEGLRDRLVAEAAKLGGDAVILSRRTADAGTVLMPVGSQFFAVPVTESGLVGQVIIYVK